MDRKEADVHSREWIKMNRMEFGRYSVKSSAAYQLFFSVSNHPGLKNVEQNDTGSVETLQPSVAIGNG